MGSYLLFVRLESRLHMGKKTGDNFLKRMAEYEKYLGKYTRTSAEKYEEFLKELDVSWPLRKLALASTPVLEVILFTITKNITQSVISAIFGVKIQLFSYW